MPAPAVIRDLDPMTKVNQKLKKGKYQTDLHGNNLDIEDLESYGDELLKQKEKGIIRIGLQNANNLPEYKQHEKNKQFLKYIYEHDFDLWMLNKIGLNWKRIDSSNSFYERIVDYLKPVKYKIAYNRHDSKNNKKFQYRGTGVIAAGKMSNKVIKKGQDTTGLGRW